MINFDFCVPTKIYFGRQREEEIGDIISSYGFKKILVVIGMSSVRKSGLFDRVIAKLDEKNIEHYLLEGVRVNPTIENVLDGLKIAKENNVELILAIGGGSVIDTAKSIAAGYYYDGNPFDFNEYKAKPTKALPIGVILTISAAGSEMSNSCVIQDDKTQYKAGFNSDLLRPLFAIENPELTYSVSKTQTAYGIVDTLMHTLERYVCPSTDDLLADEIALGLIKSTMVAGQKAMQNPHDFNARANLMLNSSISHNGWTNIGKKHLLAVHSLEHCLSGVYPNIAHAEGLAVLWASWARTYVEKDLDKFDRLAREVFGLNNENKLENALKGIEMMEIYFNSLGLKISLSSLNNGDINIEKLVQRFSPDGTRLVAHHSCPMDKNIAKQIFELAYMRKEMN